MKHLTLLLALFLTVACSPTRLVISEPVSQSPSHASQSRSQEKRIFRNINNYRTSHGKPALKYDQNLAAIALRHSLHMVQNHKRDDFALTHEGFYKRADEAIKAINLRGFGENLAVSRHSPEKNLPVIINGWYKSKTHRDTLMNNFDLTGVGTATAPDGSVYATQLFGQSKSQ